MRWRASAGISARSYARRSRWEDQPGGRGRRCCAWVRAVVAAYAASAARVGLRKIAPSWSATMRPWKSADQGRVHGEAVLSPRRVRLSASALRVARRLAEPESCCAGSQASCTRKEAGAEAGVVLAQYPEVRVRLVPVADGAGAVGGEGRVGGGAGDEGEAEGGVAWAVGEGGGGVGGAELEIGG